MCRLLDAEDIFKSFANILQSEEVQIISQFIEIIINVHLLKDLEFATILVDKLNEILLIAPELDKMRQMLIHLKHSSNCETFEILYRYFCQVLFRINLFRINLFLFYAVSFI